MPASLARPIVESRLEDDLQPPTGSPVDLLTTLYVFRDDRIPPGIGLSRDHVRGRKPRLVDAELLCVIVAQHLLQFDSGTRWIRYANTHLRGIFPLEGAAFDAYRLAQERFGLSPPRRKSCPL